MHVFDVHVRVLWQRTRILELEEGEHELQVQLQVERKVSTV
jgi:hypothetical protein